MLEYLGVLCFAFLLGSIASLLVVAYFFHKYLSFSSVLYKKSSTRFKSVRLSEILKENLSSKPISSIESCRYLNVILAFVFSEWRDTATVQRWIVKKVNVEIEELLETKAARRLINAIKINDVSLGSSPPIIHGVAIKEPCTFSSDIPPDRVVLDIDVEYEGGFYLAVDVDLRFGKSAFVSIAVRRLKGQIRLQFNRLPCTHWSVCFVDEPVLDIKIDPNFLSRPLPQLGSLILNQVYRTIRRKHTFPKYKVRYTPFNAFWIDHMTDDDDNDVETILSRLDVTIVSCSRLLLPHAIAKPKDNGTCAVLFATLSLDPVSCVGLEPTRPGSTDLKKNNFLLTSIADALSEFDENNKFPPGAPEDPVADGGDAGPPKISSNGDASSPDRPSSNGVAPPRVVVDSPNTQSVTEGCDNNNNKEPAAHDSYLPGFATAASPSSTVADLKRSQGEEGKRPVGDGTSYMMVTRNFSAVLSEEASTKADGSRSVNVLVGSIVWNRNAGMKTTISEGDKILSINGNPVDSLSQAIAVINDIRTQRSRFYFKVQRNRRRSRGASLRSTKESDGVRSRSASSPVHFPFDDSPSSDDADEPAPEDDTESDFSDLDTEEQESFVNEGFVRKRNKLTPSSSPYRGIRQQLISDIIKTSSPRQADDSSSPDDDLKFAEVSSTFSPLQTSLCDADQPSYSWPQDEFSLGVESSHRFLNVRFWYKEVATTSLTRKDNLTLVGSLAVPLRFLQRHCGMMTSGCFTRRFKVLSPLAVDSDVRRTADRIFKQRSGFRLEHCYGDVTLSTKAVTST